MCSCCDQHSPLPMIYFLFLSEMIFAAKSNQILIWVITLKVQIGHLLLVHKSVLYEIILQQRSSCESQAQLQLDLSPRSECNMYQYKNKSVLEQGQFILIVLGPSHRTRGKRKQSELANITSHQTVRSLHETP